MHSHAARTLRARVNGTNASLFELLEHRTLPSGSISVSVKDTDWGTSIVVAGTAANDSVTISQDTKGVLVNDGTKSTRIRKRVKAIVVAGEAGDDEIVIRKSVTLKVVVDSGDGDDVITGGAGRDTLLGGEGDDRISGGANNDVLGGQDGNDTLFGNAGKDLLVGGDDDDILVAVGGGTYDSLQGDAGFDSFWLDDSAGELVGDDKLERRERNNGAVHRVRGFLDYVNADGAHRAIGIDPNGENLPDPAMATDADGKPTAQEWRDFAAFPLFDETGPMMEDVRQGSLNTCYFMATLSGIASLGPDRIRQSIVDLGDGTFAVRFYDKTGQATYVRVDGDLPVNIDAEGNTPPAYAGVGPTNAIWVALMEKAFCYYRDPFYVTEQEPVVNTSYHNIEFGYMDEVPNAMGADDVFATTPGENPYANGYDMLDDIQRELDAGRLVTYETRTRAFGGLQKSHAYTVIGVEERNGERFLRLRNPWGTDGPSSTDGKNDGYITVHASDAFSSMMSVQSSRV